MICCNKIKNLSSRQLFLLGARLTFGSWLFYIGLMKWIGGSAGFVGYITTQFADTWLPSPLVLISAWVILVAEPLIGAWLVSGVAQRCAWLAATKLMFLLLFGQAVMGNNDVIANWHYVVFCLVSASFSCNNSSCCDKSSQCGDSNKTSCGT